MTEAMWFKLAFVWIGLGAMGMSFGIAALGAACDDKIGRVAFLVIAVALLVTGVLMVRQGFVSK
jgi:hypothetical protein